MEPTTAYALATAAAGAMQYISQLQTNEANKGLSYAQMQFQERMSSTAYQRAVEDMKKAGLNPALMYGKGSGGASTPIGSKADLKSPGDEAGKTASAYALGRLQAEILSKESKIKDEQLKQTAADTKIREIEAEIKEKTKWSEMMSRHDANVYSSAESLTNLKMLQERKKTELEQLKRDFERAKKDKDYAEMDSILNRIRQWIPFTNSLMSK